MKHTTDPASEQWEAVLSHPQFAAVDTALRGGGHITAQRLDRLLFVQEHEERLRAFYALYQASLLRAPEGFFFLTIADSSPMGRRQLSLWDMAVGKVLCFLYLSSSGPRPAKPVFLADIVQALQQLLPPERLLAALGTKAMGSDVEKERLLERLRTSLGRLKRMGMVSSASGSEGVYLSEAVLRFASDVREGAFGKAQLFASGEAGSLVSERVPVVKQEQ